MTNQPGHDPLIGPVQAPQDYPFPKDATGLLPWSYALTQLEAARNYWLATTRPNGRPHVTPLWGVWVANAWYGDGAPTTQWSRNLATNPQATLHLESGEEVVIVEGAVENIMSMTDADLAARIVAAWDAKYGRLQPDPVGNGIVCLRPRTVRAWSSSSLQDGTRWHFATSSSQHTFP